ncbi:MAG: RsmE family RNA methyltransferase [Treponema sp.]|nr:RsmE family RNA methyltransferase [Treponema sp.]
MNICLFSEAEINQPLDLKDERAQHLIKILHKKEGDTFTAGIIGGKAGLAKITSTSKAITFTFEPLSDGKKLYPLKMIIGFPRPIQLKRLLRDVAALGVCQVHLCGSDLGEKSYLQSTLVEKGNAYKMLLDGTVQAGSTNVPELFMHKNLDQCLEALEEERDSGVKKIKVALDNVKPICSLSQAVHDIPCTSCETPCSSYEVIAAIGSERGWTDRERNLLQEKAFILCGMGPRIMRTETAATVAGAIILNEIGVLK